MSEAAEKKEEEVIEDRGDELNQEPTSPAEEEEEQKSAAEEEEEQKPDAEEEEEQKPAAQGVRIPKFRFDAMSARAKAAEARAAELEAQLKSREEPTPAPQMDKTDDLEVRLGEIDEELAEAATNADAKRVAALMKESREIQAEQLRNEMQETRRAAVTDSQESMIVNNILDQLENDFPEFDENSDKFNQELNDKVVELQQGYMALGKSQSEALLEAINIGVTLFGLNTGEAQTETPTKKTNVKKNVEDASKQPPNMQDIGDDSDSAGQKGSTVDVTQLTEAEFDALPDATKRSLRGDTV